MPTTKSAASRVERTTRRIRRLQRLSCMQAGLRALVCLTASAGMASAVRAKEPIPCKPEAWAKAIAKFEEEDQKMPPPKQGALFLGSSSIRLWDVNKWFPRMPTVNRGFGGSQICHSTHYADRLVTIHQPRIVVFYAGDNDLAAGKSPEQVRDDFRAFVEKVRLPQPELPIAFIAIKPSVARWKLADKIKEANRLIQEDAERSGNIDYVDVWPAMLNADGKPREELFAEDGLHMNDAGYKIWTELVAPLVMAKVPMTRRQ